jgi:hypothetical protein
MAAISDTALLSRCTRVVYVLPPGGPEERREGEATMTEGKRSIGNVVEWKL